MGQQVDLFDCRFRSIYEVYTYLAANTTIRPTVPELVERGWIPLIQSGLVGLTTSGYLKWTGDANAKRLNSDTVLTTSNEALERFQQSGLGIGSIAVASADANRSIYLPHKLASFGVALVAGAKADQQLLAATSGVKGRILLRSIMSDTNIAAGFTAHFEDSTPTDCSGLPGGTIVFGAITAYTPVQLNPPILVYNLTADKNIRVDYTNGAGVEYIVLQYETWLEG